MHPHRACDSVVSLYADVIQYVIDRPGVTILALIAVDRTPEVGLETNAPGNGYEGDVIGVLGLGESL